MKFYIFLFNIIILSLNFNNLFSKNKFNKICLRTITKKKDKILNQKLAKFELTPYSEKIKDILPENRFEILDCFVIFNNKTNKIFKINFFYRKDRYNKSCEISSILDKHANNLINNKKITGFVLPKIKWREKLNIDPTIISSTDKFEILKDAPLIGFSITLLNEDIPAIPEFLLPKEKSKNSTFIYNIVNSGKKPGFEIEQI